VREAIFLPDREPLLPFGARLAASRAGRSFCGSKIQWRLLLVLRALPMVYAPCVSSGEVVLARNQTNQCFAGVADRSPAGLCLAECRYCSPTSWFGVLVRETALRVGVEPRALAVLALLHFPRVASYEGWVTRWQAEREVRISAERLRREAGAARAYVPVDKFPLRDLVFEEIDSSCATPVLTSLHYLRSVRSGSRYFALVDPVEKRPVTICAISPLQWKCVAREIWAKFAIPPDRAWDVSRVYSVEHAPPNAISSLLSKVRTYVRHNVSMADLLITAVDPNLGYTGASYRAANWQQWMTVRARPYLYEDGGYVSPRQLHQRYGTASLVELRAKYADRSFQQSKVRLLDPIIYCCNVTGATKIVLAQQRRRLNR
jgi:hypothetical protein